MDDNALQPTVAAEFLALADVLETTADSEWNTPSLCEGWRVREVIAHMTMAARYSEEQFMTELEKSGFDFSRLSNRIARQDCQLSTFDLVGNLRADVMLHWTPPGGGYHGALNHVVIHGLDVTVPLGLPRLSPDTTIRIVLDDLTVGGGHSHFGIELIGRRLEATDIDWAYGSGDALRGEAQDLALVICGRAITEGRLQGDPLV